MSIKDAALMLIKFLAPYVGVFLAGWTVAALVYHA
jgi:uncharacterized membrane protein YqaE (UPF0057 family)